MVGRAHQPLRRRGISYAVVCNNDTGKGFGQRLAAGVAPDWMKSVPFKGGPAEFRLYRVAN